MRPRGGIIGKHVAPGASMSAIWTLQEAQEQIARSEWPSFYDANFSSVSLLLDFEGNFNNTGPTLTNPLTITASGGMGTSTAQAQFGTRSALFDGVDDRLEISGDTGGALNFGSGNFTLEAWVYPTAYSRESIASPSVFESDIVILAADGPTFFFIQNSASAVAGRLAYFSLDNAAQIQVASTVTVAKNTWSHVACTRSGSTVRLFINGTQVASGTDARTFTNSISSIGRSASSADRFFTGYIDSVRITKGVARYTGSFSVQSYDWAKK